MRQKVKEIMANTLGIDVKDIDESQDLRGDLALEAQTMTDLLESIEGEVGMEIPTELIRETETVEEFLDMIEDFAHEL